MLLSNGSEWQNHRFQHVTQICRAGRTFPSPTSNTSPHNKRRLSSSARGQAALHLAAEQGQHTLADWFLAAGAAEDPQNLCHQVQINQHMHANANSFAWDAHHFQSITVQHTLWVRDMATAVQGETAARNNQQRSTTVYYCQLILHSFFSLLAFSALLDGRFLIFGVWRTFPGKNLQQHSHCKTDASSDGISSGGVSCSNSAQPVSQAERHCIVRRRKATPPSWSGSWLPVPPSTRWTTTAAASELEESTRILHKSVGIFPPCEFILLENFHQLRRHDTLWLGRERGSRDDNGLVKTCAPA